MKKGKNSLLKTISKKRVQISMLLFLLLNAGILMLPRQVLALCDSGKTGPKLGNRIDFLRSPQFDGFIRTKYDERNEHCHGDPVSVTILLTFDEVANDTGGTGSVQDILTKMKTDNLIPTIRLYTSYTGSGFTSLDPVADRDLIIDAAQNLGTKITAAGWGSGEVIVYVGNEINSPEEWPEPAGGIDNASITQRLKSFGKVFSLFAENAPSNYRVFLPPLNAYLGSCQINLNYQGWVNTLVSSSGENIDGAAFTIYNFDSAQIQTDFDTMRSAFSNLNVNSFVVSEVGPKTSDGIGSCRLLDRADDLSAWEQQMTALYSQATGSQQLAMFNDAVHINSSFFLNCNNNLNSYLVVIGWDGVVGVEVGEGLSCDNVSGSYDPGRRPLDEGFYPNRYACDETTDDEFHPLRPYPASACDPLIPKSYPEAPATLDKKYNTFACGTSITLSHTERFNPYGEPNGGVVTSPATGIAYKHTYCEPRKNPGGIESVNCWRSIVYTVDLNFRNSNLGILGNTQHDNLTDEQRVNNYLSWYFTGVPQVGDHAVLDPQDEDELNAVTDRVVNFSGPLRKLLPFDTQMAVKSALTTQPGTNIHDYTAGCKRDIDVQYIVNVVLSFIGGIGGNFLDLVRLGTSFAKLGISQLRTLGVFFANLTNVSNVSDMQNALQNAGFSSLVNDAQFAGDMFSLLPGGWRRLGHILSTITLDAVESCDTSDNEIRLSEYDEPYPNGNLPPDPLAYDDFNDFWRNYLAWRGLTWFPFVGYQDVPNPFAAQEIWAQLFPNIPFGGLEDIAGEITVGGLRQGASPNKGTIPFGINIIDAQPAR